MSLWPILVGAGTHPRTSRIASPHHYWMHTGAHTSPTVGCRPSATPACTAASSGLRQGSGYATATSTATLFLRPNLAALGSDTAHGTGAIRHEGKIALRALVYRKNVV